MKSVFFDLDEHKTGDFARDIAYRRKILKIILAASTLLFLYYSVNAFFLEETALIFLNLFCAGLGVLGLFFSIRNHEFAKALRIYRAVALSYAFSLLALHVYIFGFIGRVEFIGWIVTVPAFCFFLLGPAAGGLSATVYIVFMGWALFIEAGAYFPGESSELKKQTFYSLVINSALCYCYEHIRTRIKINYFESRKRLAETQSRLKRKNRKLRQFVSDLRETRKQLENLNRNLEKRVRKRTMELSEHNRRLSLEIRDRRQVEKKLQESEAKYRQIVENVPTAIFEFDLVRAVFLSVNEHTCRILGYSERQLLEMDPFALFDEDYRAVFKRRLEKMVSEKKDPPPFEYRITASDGRSVWAYGATKIFYENGRPARTLTVAQDVTDRKMLEQRFLQVQKREALGTLAGGIAHNLNNLLMGIQGNAALAGHMIGRSHPAGKYLENLEKTVDDAALLVHQFLGFARGGKRESAVTDIKNLVSGVIAMFSRTRKDIRLFTYFQEKLPEVEIDRGQIEQAILNILVNAWQAMPDGGDIYVEARRTEIGRDPEPPRAAGGLKAGKYVAISIADTGVGMDKTTLNRIFDPFFTTKSGQKGTGLGLASAYGVVKNHRGEIQVESEPGKGSTFSVFLPVFERKSDPEKPAPRQAVSPCAGSVLLVDDEKIVLEATKPMLEVLGYRVIAVDSGEKALETLKMEHGKFDLVILDMIMPRMSGTRCLEKIRETAPDVKILVTTGYASRDETAKPPAAAWDGSIRKPFQFKELSRKIIELIDTPQSERPWKAGL